MSTFDEVFNAIKNAVTELAGKSFADAKDAATKDAQAFIDKAKVDLERWTSMLTAGNLKPDELAFLVEAKKDLAAMNFLKQAGMAQIRIDKFFKDVVNIVATTVTKLVGK